MAELTPPPLFSPRERRILLWLGVAAVCWRWLLASRAPLPSTAACLDLWVAQQLANGDFAALGAIWWRPCWAVLLAPLLAAGVAPMVAGQAVGCILGGLAIWPAAMAAERLRRGAGVPAAVIVLAAAMPASGAAVAGALPFGTCMVALAADCWLRGRWLPALLLAVAAAASGFEGRPFVGPSAWPQALSDLRDAWSLALPFALLALLPPWPARIVPLWSVAALALAVGWSGGLLREVLPLWSPLVALLAAAGIARWPLRLGELALAGFVVVGFLGAWRRSEPRDAIVERLLGAHLAQRHGPTEAVVADLPRLLFFAGQRPVPPADRDSFLAAASAPGVAFVVLGASVVPNATVTAALSGRFVRYQSPAELRDLVVDRHLTVFVRRE